MPVATDAPTREETTFRMAGKENNKPVADQCRIYVSLTPLFAPSA